MSDLALFERLGPDSFRPTEASTGAWDASLLHGAPLAALLAGRLAPDTGTVARFSIDFLRPVPMDVLTVEVVDTEGGSRVRRRRARVTVDGREVASAEVAVVREGSLELPGPALSHPTPFDPRDTPDLSTPHPGAADAVGWSSFIDLGLAIEVHRVGTDDRPHQWVALTRPVLADAEPLGIETAVVAADLAQTAVHLQLPFRSWSYRNAEMTVHLSRSVRGEWVGVRSEAVVDAVGAGFNAADLFDEAGRVGRSASVLVVEARPA